MAVFDRVGTVWVGGKRQLLYGEFCSELFSMVGGGPPTRCALSAVITTKH